MFNFTAVPLAARDMGRELLAETVTRKAGFCSCKTCTSTVRGGRMRVRAPWMGSLRVSARSYRFMSRFVESSVNACYIAICIQ